MTPNPLVRLLLATLALCAVGLPAAAADAAAKPAIEGFGGYQDVAGAAWRPDPSREYKVVFSLTSGPRAPGELNHALDRVARTVNLYTGSGVPLSKLKFVVVIHGAATPLVLDAAQFKARFNVDNPNLPLVAALRKAGVDVAVCAQSVFGQKYEMAWVDKSITVALSALTTVTMLQHDGYALMPL